MDSYYKDQAGSGLGGYSGARYQKGHGWFGRIVSGGLVPILRRVLPYLGKRALETGVGLANDVMEGENFKSSARKRFKAAGKRLEGDALARVRQMTGGGVRRRKKARKTKISHKKNKRSKAKAPKRKRRRRISFL